MIRHRGFSILFQWREKSVARLPLKVRRCRFFINNERRRKKQQSEPDESLERWSFLFPLAPIFRSMMIKILLFILVSSCSLVFNLEDRCENYFYKLNSSSLDAFLPISSRQTRFSSFISNPCDQDQSIIVRQPYFYQFNRQRMQWKQLCIREQLFFGKVIDRE